MGQGIEQVWGRRGGKTRGRKWGVVSGLCAVVATSQTDGAALIVWYVHRGGGGGGGKSGFLV